MVLSQATLSPRLVLQYLTRGLFELEQLHGKGTQAASSVRLSNHPDLSPSPDPLGIGIHLLTDVCCKVLCCHLFGGQKDEKLSSSSSQNVELWAAKPGAHEEQTGKKDLGALLGVARGPGGWSTMRSLEADGVGPSEADQGPEP